MGPVDESAVPPARKARKAFTTAMDGWDESAADAAVASLARSAGSNEVYELFFRYGARDFRSIGHKAIYVANSWRTLQCIGWQHAEPVLRSLAYALLMHEDGNPARRDDPADRPWKHNQERADRINEGWTGGKSDAVGHGRPARHAPQGLRRRRLRPGGRAAQPRGLPAVDLGRPVRRRRRTAAPPAGDRLAARGHIDQRPAFCLPGQRRRPDSPAAHAPERRVPLHVPRGHGRPRQGGRRSDRPARTGRDSEAGPGAIEEIFAEASHDRMTAARKALAYLQAGRDPQAGAIATLIDARRLVFLKGNDAHDYKFSSAVLEDYDQRLARLARALPGLEPASPAWLGGPG